MADEEVTIKLTLEDLIPERPEFKLRATGDRAHALRPPTLDDAAWIRRTYGSQEKFQEICQKLQWEEIFKAVYHLLVDRAAFPGFEEENLDDEGKPVKEWISGPRNMLKCVSGIEEGFKVMGALNRAIAASSPVMEKMIREELKKNILQSQTGGKSSTSSQASTDGASSGSAPAPSERSA